jgi:hypothetical protein
MAPRIKYEWVDLGFVGCSKGIPEGESELARVSSEGRAALAETPVDLLVAAPLTPTRPGGDGHGALLCPRSAV